MPNPLADALTISKSTDSCKRFAELEDGNVVTYAEFFNGARQIASLITSCGIKPGDRVAVMVEKSIAVLQTYLGSVMSGAAFLPLNPAYTDSEVRFFLQDASPSLFICDPARQDTLSTSAKSEGVRDVLTLDANGSGSLKNRIHYARRDCDPVPRSYDDLAAILYTSGTTGRPKGAMLSHSSLVSNAATLKSLWRFTKSDVLLHALPVHHTHGLFVATNVALMAGCSLLYFQKFDAEKIVRALARATVMMGVPTFYTRLLKREEISKSELSNMRLFISGSAPLRTETHREWERRTGHRILERYGMTEANMIASIPYDGPRKPGTVGIPLPGVQTRICDPETGRIVPEGEIGMLEVRGSGMFSGYWNMPDKTRREHREGGFFMTGDLARVDEDSFLAIEGRAKDLIISGGMNIYPKEVEAVIDDVPGILESAVFAAPHEDFGEGVVAAVVADSEVEVTEREIRDHIAANLAKYKHPKHIAFRKFLPRNSMGKVQKAVLRDEHGTVFASC